MYDTSKLKEQGMPVGQGSQKWRRVLYLWHGSMKIVTNYPPVENQNLVGIKHEVTEGTRRKNWENRLI